VVTSAALCAVSHAYVESARGAYQFALYESHELNERKACKLPGEK
jgi:hypothetical protein